MSTTISEHLKKAEEALQAGQIDEAEAMFGALLDNDMELDSEQKGRAIAGRGVIRYHRGHFDAATVDLREALALLETASGGEAAVTASAKMFLARTLVAKGENMPGCTLGHEALKTLEAALPEDAPLIAEACFLLSQAEYQLNDLTTAEALTRRAMTIWEKVHGPEWFGISTCLNNLGRIYEERGLPAEGINFHRQALALRLKLLGDHEETAFSLGNLGTALAANKQWQEAAQVLEECLACYAKAGTKDGFKVEGYRRNLEICLQSA